MATVGARSLRGLALPAIRGQGGYFASKTGIDVAWGDLILTLFTPIGSRPMNRTFGSGLTDALFAPTGPALGELVNHTIRDAAARWCPHVQIDDVRVVEDGLNVRIGVSLSLASDRSTADRQIMLPKSDLARYLANASNGVSR